MRLIESNKDMRLMIQYGEGGYYNFVNALAMGTMVNYKIVACFEQAWFRVIFRREYYYLFIWLTLDSNQAGHTNNLHNLLTIAEEVILCTKYYML